MDDKSVARLLGQLVAYELSYGVDDIVATLRSIKGAINAKTVNLNIDSLFAAVFDNAEKEYAELLSDLKVKSVFTQSVHDKYYILREKSDSLKVKLKEPVQ